MTITAFDTHEVAEILSNAGFNKEQVNAQVGVLTEVTSELVTKTDLSNALAVLKRDIIITVGVMQFTVALLMLTAIKFIIV